MTIATDRTISGRKNQAYFQGQSRLLAAAVQGFGAEVN